MSHFIRIEDRFASYVGIDLHTTSLTLTATSAKVQTRWLLHQGNAAGPKLITGASMQRWLHGQGHDLDPLPCALLEHWHETILMFERIRVDLRRRMLGIVRADETLTRNLELLMSPRGIGEILGIIIQAEFGDFHRFKNADAVACWTGLTERSHVSNRQKYPGKISKAGSATLRWALCEAAFQLNCSDETFHEQYERVKRKTSVPGKARVAMARRLARCLWKVVVSETPFRVGPSRNRAARANEVRLRRKRRQEKRTFAKQDEINTMDAIAI